MVACNGHQIGVQAHGLEIDGQCFRWDEMCLAHPRSPRQGLFHGPTDDLSKTLPQVLRYPGGDLNLAGCEAVLDAVQRHVRQCDT